MVKIGGWGLPKTKRSEAPFFTKNQIVTVFDQVAVLLELDGANLFRVRAYQNASRALGQLEKNLFELVKSDSLTQTKGIGKGLASLVEEIVMTGEWGKLKDLYDKVPAGLVEMVGIPGLGPKRARILFEELEVSTVEGLKSACEQNLVAELQGFGAKSQKKYLDGIDLLRRNQGRTRLDVGLGFGLALKKRVSGITGVIQVELAGSARRRKETIGDLDLVVSATPENQKSVIESVLNLPGIADVKGAGGSKISLILEQSVLVSDNSGGKLDQSLSETMMNRAEDSTIDAQIRIVSPEMFPFTLAYFTGSKEHNIRMRQLAIDKGLRLNEFGLMPETEIEGLVGIDAAQYSLSCVDEGQIYHYLDMDWVTPELREDNGEIEAALSKSIPNLVEVSSIRGALHNHTTASDGQNTLDEMADEARRLGWEYIGIADHSPALRIGGRSIGVDPDAVEIQASEITSYNEKMEDQGEIFRVFHGSECDILPDGKLDYSEDVRGKFHHVIGSVHAINTWKSRDEQVNTDAIITAIEDPSFTVLGHPTGRVLQVRDGFPVDMLQVIERMGEINQEGELKAIEINASPYRLDLDWRLCRTARDHGVPILINPDAHSIEGLSDIAYGVDIARKGWLEAKDVLNTLPVEKIDHLLGK
jgi:DNA polymerase (family 10)